MGSATLILSRGNPNTRYSAKRVVVPVDRSVGVSPTFFVGETPTLQANGTTTAKTRIHGAGSSARTFSAVGQFVCGAAILAAVQAGSPHHKGKATHHDFLLVSAARVCCNPCCRPDSECSVR
jgi:hypothetical protein